MGSLVILFTILQIRLQVMVLPFKNMRVALLWLIIRLLILHHLIVCLGLGFLDCDGTICTLTGRKLLTLAMRRLTV